MLPPVSRITTGVSTFTTPASRARDPDRAGRLDHQLAALDEHDHGPGDVLLGHRDHVVDLGRDVGEAQVAGPADGDAVGDRGVRLEPHRPARLQRRRYGGRALGLHPDHPDAGRLGH
jgi:hypothetical protein